ncbi:MAG: hypothetical protein DRH26_15305, partial [Deltaproteobacteria bacterium]
KRLDAARIPYWWEESTTAIKVGGFDAFEGERTVSIDITKQVKRAGLYECLLHYKTGRGSFVVKKVELLENETVIATDKHFYTATIETRAPTQYYCLKFDEFKPNATYSLKCTVEGVKGGANGVVMLLPALPSSDYSKASSPDTKANISNNNRPEDI